jgi:molybdopterin molybdotransferase
MTERLVVDDCFLHDGDRLKHEEAVDLILERVLQVAGIESVPLAEASERVIAEDVVAPRDVPGFTNAAVDGYAFAHSSLGAGETRLKVVMRSAAGDEARGVLKRGEAARIFTGAALPQGADTCAMQEDVKAEGNHIIVGAGVKLGANRRMAGEDVRSGAVVVKKGTRLRPQDVAAIASTGAAKVKCFERLKAGLVSTGNELKRPGEALKEGDVYDSNHFMLRSLLVQAGVQVEDFGIIADERDAVDHAMRQAAKRCDVILSTGGASRGEADHVVKVIAERGVLHAWQLAVKPGRPLAMGQIGGKIFLALPGNPVAVFVTFLLYALPMLSQLQGLNWRPPQRYPIRAGFSFSGKKKGRREFWRGWIEETPQGARLRKFERDGSGIISGLRQASGLIEVKEDVTDIAEGDAISFIPFTEFGISPP